MLVAQRILLSYAITEANKKTLKNFYEDMERRGYGLFFDSSDSQPNNEKQYNSDILILTENPNTFSLKRDVSELLGNTPIEYKYSGSWEGKPPKSHSR